MSLIKCPKPPSILMKLCPEDVPCSAQFFLQLSELGNFLSQIYRYLLFSCFKISKHLSVILLQPFGVKLNWKAELDTGDMVVFPRFHQVPFSKILTFYRRDNFAVEAEYDGDVPVMNPHIGHFEIGEVRPLVDGSNQKVKVKVRINPVSYTHLTLPTIYSV